MMGRRRKTSQPRLDLGAGRQHRPATLRERLASLRSPARQLDPPREPIAPAMLVGGFVWQAVERGLVGAHDLRELKVLFDAFAAAENHDTLPKEVLAAELARRGIAHGRRDMQRYEHGYELAVFETDLDPPQVIFFVLPPVFPIKPAFTTKQAPDPPASVPRQHNLFAEPDEDMS